MYYILCIRMDCGSTKCGAIRVCIIFCIYAWIAGAQSAEQSACVLYLVYTHGLRERVSAQQSAY